MTATVLKWNEGRVNDGVTREAERNRREWGAVTMQSEGVVATNVRDPSTTRGGAERNVRRASNMKRQG